MGFFGASRGLKSSRRGEVWFGRLYRWQRSRFLGNRSASRSLAHIDSVILRQSPMENRAVLSACVTMITITPKTLGVTLEFDNGAVLYVDVPAPANAASLTRHETEALALEQAGEALQAGAVALRPQPAQAAE
jgi:hypothetical protein